MATDITDARVVAKGLTAARRRNLLALPRQPGAWMTVSEMRGDGATGAGMDLLEVMHRPRLCERRWTKWGSDRVHGQLRGEGYEYSITNLGVQVASAVREILLSEGGKG